MTTPVHNNEMNLAWQYIAETHTSVFLTGKAGTGKTTFLRRVRELSPKRMIVVAPTGVAAINAHGVTIHSFFQIAPGLHVPGQGEVSGSRNKYQFSKEKKNILRTLDLLVIDEVSMVRADLMDAIDEVMRRYANPSKPFGGVQLLLIGDLHQLPPIVEDKEKAIMDSLYPTPHFFSSHALQQLPYVTIELKHIYRQSDLNFINLLGKVRTGQIDSATLSLLNSRYVPGYEPREEEESIRLTTHNRMASDYNERKLAALRGNARTFTCDVDGDFPANSYPADEQLRLKPGAQVMFLKNDTGAEREYYNGKIGHVVSFADDTIMVRCKDDTHDICVSPAEWENTRIRLNEKTKELKEEVIGRFVQYPLRLAWAITVHKSQGLTFDRAVLDVNRSFAPGQLYVALSRCRSLEGMVLTEPIRPYAAQTDHEAEHFMVEQLEASADAPTRLPALRDAFSRELLRQLFDFGPLSRSVERVLRAIMEVAQSVRPQMEQDWDTAKDALDDRIQPVAVKFNAQLDTILSQPKSAERTERLQERVQRAAFWFADELSVFDSTLRRTLQDYLPKVGNKAVKTRLENAVETFRVDFQTLAGCLRLTAEHGFKPATFMNDRAQATLEALSPETAEKKRKEAEKARKAAEKAKKAADKAAAKAQRAAKEKTWDTTFRLFRDEGKSITDIARERKLTVGTIFSHLQRFLETGDIRLPEIVPDSHISTVRAMVEAKGWPESMGDFMRSLPVSICYPEVALILSLLRKEKKVMSDE